MADLVVTDEFYWQRQPGSGVGYVEHCLTIQQALGAAVRTLGSIGRVSVGEVFYKLVTLQPGFLEGERRTLKDGCVCFGTLGGIDFFYDPTMRVDDMRVSNVTVDAHVVIRAVDQTEQSGYPPEKTFPKEQAAGSPFVMPFDTEVSWSRTLAVVARGPA